MWEILGAVASGIGNLFAADAQREAAEKAAQAQTEAVNRGLAFQQQNLDRGLGFQADQYNRAAGFQTGQLAAGNALAGQQVGVLQGLFGPYTQAGQQALAGLNQFSQAGLNGLQGQQALVGLLGPAAQQQAISGLSNSPEMAALTQQGEEAILQNASATGGLRGGNVQGALAQYRPQMLANLINQQYTRLGGLAGQGLSTLGAVGQMGQGSAASQAAGGLDVLRSQLGLSGTAMGTMANLSNQYGANVGSLYGDYGKNVTDLIGQQGAIGSGQALAQGQADARMWQALGGLPNQALMLQKLMGGGLSSIGTPAAASSFANPFTGISSALRLAPVNSTPYLPGLYPASSFNLGGIA